MIPSARPGRAARPMTATTANGDNGDVPPAPRCHGSARSAPMSTERRVLSAIPLPVIPLPARSSLRRGPDMQHARCDTEFPKNGSDSSPATTRLAAHAASKGRCAASSPGPPTTYQGCSSPSSSRAPKPCPSSGIPPETITPIPRPGRPHSRALLGATRHLSGLCASFETPSTATAAPLATAPLLRPPGPLSPSLLPPPLPTPNPLHPQHPRATISIAQCTRR